MNFIPNVDAERYDEFVLHHPSKSHFMQSRAWGELSEREKGMKAHYVGMENDAGELCAAALLLERKPPMFPAYFYSPRGFVLDFFDDTLLAEFTKHIREFARSRGAMFVKLDPDVELRERNSDGSLVEGGFDNTSLVERMKALGYLHRGYNLGFDRRQPRFTFRIDLTPDDAAIDKRIVGNVLKNVKKSRRYACEVRKGESTDIPTLHRLITLTSERDDFVGYPESYYQSFYDTLSKYDMARLYLGFVDAKKSVKLLKAEREALLQKRLTLKKEGPLNESLLSEQRLDREIATFERYADEYPDGAVVSAHLVVRYGDKAWAVHAGSAGIMSETFINNRVYYEKIHDAKADGAKWLDQFGTVGDPANSPLRSLHEFKAQFGGRCCEFIGEFDLVTRPFWHFLYDRLLPYYRRVRLTLKMSARKKS